ncbi:hypothetical protein [Peribacillus glennii]|uniref:Uncharacterized protein n=1 Tax=Peribacillus glennii TaxID=2303991 RepID=A0A372LBW5_9BACI|nr:hypothetical protein [Peribacillus glennii]RFU62972.1 hypothetical protein D0466_13595 [Peribacillus glennii]
MRDGGLNWWVLTLVIIAGVGVGLNINSPHMAFTQQRTMISPEEPKSQDLDTYAKQVLDELMYESFGGGVIDYEASWYDSIAESGIIDKNGERVVVLRSRGDGYDKQAEKYALTVREQFLDDPKINGSKVVLIKRAGSEIILELDRED